MHAPNTRPTGRNRGWSRIALRVLCVGVAGSCALAAETGAGSDSGETPKARELRVMTFNIRYAGPRDGANRWEARRDAVAAVIDARADVAGLQEVLAGQTADLRKRLPAFDFAGRGREREPEEGEACPVLFRRDRFEAVESGTFWLSDTPDKPGSRSWGNTLPRICTWVELREREGGRAFRVYNAHLDNAAPEARRRGLELARRRAEAWSGPVFLLGDFNEPPAGPAVAGLRAAQGWRDLWAESRTGKAKPGEGGTFNGWRAEGPYSRIDYIFLRGEAWAAKECRVERPRVSPGGGWASDHFPVIAVVEFR